ncbi:hypothetical protein DN820_17585 [Stutzerimonas nosocomialis]|uniref:Uncharacterized protein n=1 Tax=Stutzerimonas nosocomialis TaxID=1056496 RepID=A0A5R9QBM4_9GAMM|nr:hypothetical protein DN820_17585 [Stutzerimonas nosocomialis]
MSVSDGAAYTRLSRETGALLVSMLAEATGLIMMLADGTEFGSFGLNPETTKRETQPSLKTGPDSHSPYDDEHPRTQRMLRALRDMRDLRDRRATRVARAGY